MFPLEEKLRPVAPKYQIPVSGVQTNREEQGEAGVGFPKYQIPVSGVQTYALLACLKDCRVPEIPDSSKWSSNSDAPFCVSFPCLHPKYQIPVSGVQTIVVAVLFKAISSARNTRFQ